MNQYIIYTIRDKNGMALLAGAISSAYPSNETRLRTNATKENKFFVVEQQVDIRAEVIAYLDKLRIEFPAIKCKFIRDIAPVRKSPKKYKRKEESILKEKTVHRKALAKFKDEHQPGDKNGYLMYVRCNAGQYQIVKI